ncbi:TPA: GTP-binding protein, partial [Staphylococcus pseudintermedius]
MDNQQRLNRRENIRNFSIIAHIDHGKSTLADRILENTKSVESREMQAQLLDSMDLERERGITIKLNAVRLKYDAKDGQTYTFHLIDTPGHVDFTYEVSRSLAACEGAILVVDAAQGIEAQTLANVYLALDNDLELIPVINKIDLPAAEPERVKQEVEDVIGLDKDDAVLASAKANIGIEEILEKIVEMIPPPDGDPAAPLKALIFDSEYDPYRGVISSIRVVDGVVKAGDRIEMMATGKIFEVTEVGINTPKELPVEELTVGDVGYIIASIKNVDDSRVGDTITHANRPAETPLKG